MPTVTPGLARVGKAVRLTLLIAAPLGAQRAVPERTLGPLEATGSETFSQVRGFRELSDGRLLVTDQIEKKIVLLDLVHGTAKHIGRIGGGPGEYQSITDLIPMPGDTTLLTDVALGLKVLSVITPQGKLEGTRPLPHDLTMSYLFGVDRAGHLYFTPLNFRTSGESAPDSVPVLRVDFRRHTADTAFMVPLVHRDPMKPNPYNPTTQWAVGADGRVAIVTVDRYQVTWIAPNGQRTVGKPIPFERLPTTDRDRNEFRQLARRVSGLGGGGAGMRGASGAPPEMYFPPTKPPFFGNFAAMIAPNGELWVRRAQKIEETRPLHDIIDGTGSVIATVRLPPNTRLLALGAHGVYLARYDDDDLIHIERYGYPGS